MFFIAVKTAGVHALTHQHGDDNQVVHCTLCDYIMTHNHIPFLSSDTVQFRAEHPVHVPGREVAGAYHTVYIETGIPDHLFSRPPPA
ncbi:hypothetical protein [Sinomicrobium soli]|uniref:hypothetical protein n=1 Tax=Sinomicrobium sp. N-1-3-6 TaxID=2219864 RepID=UPI0011BF4CF0|nr:hypothetical protein [Sinomicrobium sp. N-1-3-6]